MVTDLSFYRQDTLTEAAYTGGKERALVCEHKEECTLRIKLLSSHTFYTLYKLINHEQPRVTFLICHQN